ncbi:2Fe-2S iron-sulfur cluster-binding protein, partial [Methylobacterium sp. E-041]|uniref:2Fe-2S iron-sulfur cluster-binding protein n=1 Tax=Methylobacterium sp. E-041 TaxID=2836573 RepID=UPI00391D8022
MAGTTACAAMASMPPAARADPGPGDRPILARVWFTINGQRRELDLDTRTTLLDAARAHLHLTGSKKGRDHGQCGTCTMIVDGRRINACLTLALLHTGAEITTIEGLGQPDAMHP